MVRFSQAFPRRRLVRRRLVSGDGVHISAMFSLPEWAGRALKVASTNVFTSRAGTHSKNTNGGPFGACFSTVLRRRLVAAPLPLTEAAFRQPLRRYQLSDPTEMPSAYRETGIAIPLSHCVPVASQTIAAARPNKGALQKKLASEAYRATEGVSRNSIANRAIAGH